MKRVFSVLTFTFVALALVADAQVTTSPGGSGLGSSASRGSSAAGDVGVVRGSSAPGDAGMAGGSAAASTGSGNFNTGITDPTTGITTFGVTGSPSPSSGLNSGITGSANPNVDNDNLGIRGPGSTGFQTAPRPIGEGSNPFNFPPTPQTTTPGNTAPGTR